MKETVAQILGIFGIAVFLLCFHVKDMKSARKVKMLVDIIWGTHYLLLGAWSGFLINVICFFREIVFLNSDKKFFSGKKGLYIFIAVNLASAAFTWQNFYSLLPAITACIGTYTFWQKNLRVARGLALTNNVLMFTYDIFVSSYTGLIGESLAFLSVLLAIARTRRRHKQNESQEENTNEVRGN